MPELCRFFGIIIAMYWEDHQPPHFHARYGEYEAVFSINDFELIKGQLPPRVISLVLEWAFRNRQELIENWTNCCNKLPIKPITPLE